MRNCFKRKVTEMFARTLLVLSLVGLLFARAAAEPFVGNGPRISEGQVRNSTPLLVHGWGILIGVCEGEPCDKNNRITHAQTADIECRDGDTVLIEFGEPGAAQKLMTLPGRGILFKHGLRCGVVAGKLTEPIYVEYGQ